MLKFKLTTIAYIAGFIDGDGSIYVRLKPNNDYKYNYQISPYIILFQSSKDEKKFLKICNLLDCGYLRRRKDGILEYTIGREKEIINLIELIRPYLILKKKQADLMLKILKSKRIVKSQNDFIKLVTLIDKFRELNYSKKRIKYKLTP